MINFKKLLFSILICEAAGVVGSIFTFPSINSWYTYLNKPFFNPPNWIFGPVWTTLYILMGISLYLVWQTKTKVKEKKYGLIYFFLQLIFNSFWSIVFFGMHSIKFSYVVIVVLWILIAITMMNFEKVRKEAMYLLLPYILWVSFASILNLFLIILNP